MKSVYYIVVFILMCSITDSFSQRKDSLVMPQDTVLSLPSEVRDTILPDEKLPSDTTIAPQISSGSYTISENGIDETVEYGAQDSNMVDLIENKIHLWGSAYVKYLDYDLQAGYIIFDFDDNEATAFRLEDSLGRMRQRPDFSDGTNQFMSNKLRFNFKTKKGLIYDAVTEEGEFTIHGAKTKFVSKDSDTLAIDDQIFNQDAIITTCTADHPHFGIRASKLKVVPNKLAILGLSQLEIMGIPTPLILPFGFFPLVKGRSSGLIFPSDYEYNDNLGLGFREIGYYFPINDYMDMRVTGDIYTRGTHRINVRTDYKKRYKYRGNISLGYANNISENPTDGLRQSNKSFTINISHTQDPKAHPYSNFGGSINLSTNRHDQRNRTDFNNVVNNKISSTFSYSHEMPGTPFSFDAAFRHAQDNRTRDMDVTLPEINLRMRSIYPFKSQDGIEQWYDKINVGYNAKFKNSIEATDTTLFTQEALDNMQTGLSHKATANASFNILKYFNLNTNVDFEQFVFTRILQKELVNTEIIDTIGFELDQDSMLVPITTTTNNMIVESFDNGLATLEKFGMGAQLATQLFATQRFKKGWLRGLRHTMKPSVGFTYRPDTKEKYEDVVILPPDVDDIDDIDDIDPYNPYVGGAFRPSLNTKQMALTYRIANLFEGKYYSKKDSTEKKFKLLQSMNVSGDYNFAADSLKASPLSISGNTRLFKGITSINFSASYNFYVKNEKGQLINRSVWEEKKKLMEFNRFNFTISNGLTLGQLGEMLFKKKKSETEKTNGTKNGSFADQSLGDLVHSFRINHSFRFELSRLPSGRDTSLVRAHSIGISGNVPLTDNWNLSISNISYDLVNDRFVYPQFSLNRDLHCWTMQFTWSPAIETYSFFIGVKSNSLSFLKYNYGQRNASQLFGR